MKKPVVLLATATSALALAGAVAVGVAHADPTSSPTTSSGPTTSQTAKGTHTAKGRAAGKHRLVRRALHGEATLGGKKHRVVDFQRGTVSAVTSGSVTVRSADGFVGTYVVGSGSKVRVAGKPAAIGDVATGDHVRVVAVKTGSTATVKRILDRQK